MGRSPRSARGHGLGVLLALCAISPAVSAADSPSSPEARPEKEAARQAARSVLEKRVPEKRVLETRVPEKRVPEKREAKKKATAAVSTNPALKAADGLSVGEDPTAQCLPKCGFPRLTDPDNQGNLDGFGYEGQRTCIADGTTLALSLLECDVAPLGSAPLPGSGIFRETRCLPVCSSGLTDRDPKTGMNDGWGYERRRDCIVSGSAAALGGLPCDPGEKPLPVGDGVDVVVGDGKIECRPFCR
ncbi:MAG: hypothetical protein RL033_7654, partial [Pseudomonadota bacterium]